MTGPAPLGVVGGVQIVLNCCLACCDCKLRRREGRPLMLHGLPLIEQNRPTPALGLRFRCSNHTYGAALIPKIELARWGRCHDKVKKQKAVYIPATSTVCVSRRRVSGDYSPHEFRVAARRTGHGSDSFQKSTMPCGVPQGMVLRVLRVPTRAISVRWRPRARRNSRTRRGHTYQSKPALRSCRTSARCPAAPWSG